MTHTGKTYNTILGNIDSSTGAFRKGNVSAGSSYFVHYDKVETMTTRLAKKLQALLCREKGEMAILETSFIAHFDLVSIHPFYDGNGRTSRLMMNYIQSLRGLPLARVFSEDKVAYIEALEDTRNKKDLDVFISFMFSQYGKMLHLEIEKYLRIIKDEKGGKGYSLIF